MNSDDPIAFFITWTVYGTHLQGDERGWRRRRKGDQQPQPRLAQWRRERLKHEWSCCRLSNVQFWNKSVSDTAIIGAGVCGQSTLDRIMFMPS